MPPGKQIKRLPAVSPSAAFVTLLFDDVLRFLERSISTSHADLCRLNLKHVTLCCRRPVSKGLPPEETYVYPAAACNLVTTFASVPVEVQDLQRHP